jgi:hypothetical protein
VLLGQVSGRLRESRRDLDDIQFPPEFLERSLATGIEPLWQSTAT